MRRGRDEECRGRPVPGSIVLQAQHAGGGGSGDGGGGGGGGDSGGGGGGVGRGERSPRSDTRKEVRTRTRSIRIDGSPDRWGEHPFVRALAVTPRATPGELLRERERKKGTRGRERKRERAGVGSFGIRATPLHTDARFTSLLTTTVLFRKYRGWKLKKKDALLNRAAKSTQVWRSLESRTGGCGRPGS
ncbi:homeobox protein Hox-B3-like [Mycetomoellerius zeteki]|uniref:homeobox protein Hox-B3-like n=1 Tax=Mycetomoellerius zeteki TaxID=64791 RepID=UPI00084EB734|nr:PREDICTED: homeobox protein Hox-B3-like [Trachymyrmex zeteki]